MKNSIDDLTGPEAVRKNQQLFFLCAGALAAAMAYYAVSANVADPLHRYQGLFMLFLAAWPALMWARSTTKHFPAFEVFCLTNANTFALPLLNGHEALSAYAVPVISTAAWAVIAYQLALLLTHAAVRGRPGTGAFWVETIFTDRFMHYLSYGTVISSAYAVISTFYPDLLPSELNSILRAICFGVGIVCTFLAARLWGLGQLTSSERIFMALNLAVQVLSQITTLYLIQGISVLLLFTIGYIVGSRRLPLVLLVSSAVLVAILHNGKSAMRAEYWAGDFHVVPKVSDAPGFFQEWITLGLNPGTDENDQAMAAKLVDRTSLFHILCLIVDYTPDRQPYLGGETYGFILPQFVPRILWANKPLGHAATYRLSTYYGLTADETTITTSIGFGMVTEAYANFGFFGVILLGCIQGALFKKVRQWSRYSPMISYGGIFLVLLMAWCFQTEYTAASWIGSFYQACIAVLGIPFLIKRLLG